LLTNLVDNAIKYAKEQAPPQIQIETRCTDRTILLRVEDNGVGMSRDTLKRIFEKFYRAHTGNRHNVKGFGLGLSYVKSVTEAMGGTIQAESTLGKGSVFTLELPLYHS
jgi:two-component system phosphate regulon sensor histidine kinase PhoR